jgi:predicted O-methyltransferase YrrM
LASAGQLELDMSETLDAIGLRFGTDKASNGNDYLSFYARYFEPMREREVKILEIGVLNGASLQTWREYFPNGTIIGVDINPAAVKHVDNRISIEIADQSSEKDLKRVASLGPFDLVLDDGSHFWRHQILTFQILAPAVRPGGFYVLEDLDTSYGHYARTYGGGISAAAYLHKLCDWIVGYRQMSDDRKIDPHLRAIWPTIDSVVFWRGTALMQRRLTPRVFPADHVQRGRTGFASRFSAKCLEMWQSRKGA